MRLRLVGISATTILQIMADCVAVVAFVGEHRARIAVPLLHQCIIGRDIVSFALGQLDGNGQTYGIAAEMDLGGEPAARTAECLSPNPALVTGSTAMRADDRAVDHLQRVKHAATVRQALQENVPNPRLTPTAKLPPDRIPVAQRSGRSRHGAPVRQIQSMPSMTRRWLAGGRPPRSEGVVRNGAIVAHSSFVIRPRITANLSAERSASNHITPGQGNPLAKKDRIRITVGAG